jgi:hypothetical protein
MANDTRVFITNAQDARRLVADVMVSDSPVLKIDLSETRMVFSPQALYAFLLEAEAQGVAVTLDAMQKQISIAFRRCGFCQSLQLTISHAPRRTTFECVKCGCQWHEDKKGVV